MIVPPNFSDKKITDLFHKDIRPNDHINYLNNFKNGYSISIYVDTIDPGILLSFYHNSYRLGVIRYYCSINPNKLGYNINNAEYVLSEIFLLESKHLPTTYDLKTVSQTRFREWLMDTPEYSEWSIWNMV